VDVVVGVDIGQTRDPTAICVAEPEWRGPELRFNIRFLERLPLGALYPDITRRLSDVFFGVQRQVSQWPRIYVDATGVGKPVVDLLREGCPDGEIIPVYFTHGDRRFEENGEVRLGKGFLVSRLQALLQTGRIHLPRTAESEVLFEELMSYEIRVSTNANDVYGAFKVGTHDDQVTALGLAVQKDIPFDDGQWVW
jgi:hypothetical protein